jgi:hypothetical protein
MGPQEFVAPAPAGVWRDYIKFKFLDAGFRCNEQAMVFSDFLQDRKRSGDRTVKPGCWLSGGVRVPQFNSPGMVIACDQIAPRVSVKIIAR